MKKYFYKAKRKKGKKQKGSQNCRGIELNYKTTVVSQTVLAYVANGIAGKSLLKMGPDGDVPDDVFKLLLTSFKTFERMKQINGEMNCNTTNLLSQHMKKTINNMSNKTYLLQRLLRQSKQLIGTLLKSKE